MKLFRTALGDRPLRLPHRGGRGPHRSRGASSVALPPLAHEFRGEREAARLEEAESVLGEYVARHGLVGADAFLALPAERVHMVRAAFPPMREKDLREAVGLELDRLFPVPPDTLRYGYLKVPGPTEGGKVSPRRGGGFQGIPRPVRSAPFPRGAVPGRIGAFGVGGGRRRLPDPRQAARRAGRLFPCCSAGWAIP